ncbi:UDP-N-acetylmuramoyl-tripeptide--D-alanyl-D-alanine ligase [Patescibacteria group bacterium]|nr:UDP-N-acetylmuramoyl-tripeptide--D-alanyl-D-alanine ligase [Patescibacteria group bacterium]
MMKQIFKKIIVFILTLEARAVLWRYKPKIAAVTGSVGKTSTKEAAAIVLGRKFSIRKSQKSFNSEIGVPLVVLGLENAWLNPLLWCVNILKGLSLFLFKHNYPEWLILEMGVERPGDIERLVSWANPHVAVVTALAEIPVHVEFFAGPKELFNEKAKILKHLKIDDYAVLNCDNDTVCDLKNKIRAKIISFGFGEGADLVASNYRVTPEGISFKVDCDGSSIPVRLSNVFGKHHVYPALAALAVGKAAGINFVEMSDALLSYLPPPGRLRLLKGVKNTSILDDTYNSSPMALRAALETLADIPVYPAEGGAGRKIAVLGDMLELGKYTIEAHRAMAEYILKAGVEIVFTVGPRAKFIAEALRENGFKKKNIFEFSGSVEAAKEVEKIIKEGDLILLKGSQFMRMEKIVEEIMAEPEKKGELLARQEKAWLNKKLEKKSND